LYSWKIDIKTLKYKSASSYSNVGNAFRSMGALVIFGGNRHGPLAVHACGSRPVCVRQANALYIQLPTVNRHHLIHVFYSVTT
jgi:hypothetical protein